MPRNSYQICFRRMASPKLDSTSVASIWCEVKAVRRAEIAEMRGDVEWLQAKARVLGKHRKTCVMYVNEAYLQINVV